jgi:tetratricopeptide (TPR) repeat protein
VIERGYESFRERRPALGNDDLNQRLFSLSSNHRVDLWRVALDSSDRSVWLGSGAGTYERRWLERRPHRLKVRDAHSLYVETWSELGPLGLLALSAALGAPVVAAVRARRASLVPAAFGAYVAYLAHRGGDWDWEMPAVTVAALACGAALLAAAGPADRVTRSRPLRVGGAAAVCALAACAFVALVGNLAAAASSTAFEDGSWSEAERHARRTVAWAPWSALGWQRLGQAQLASGQPLEARESLRRAGALAPLDWSVWFDLAQTGEAAPEQQAFRRAQALNPLGVELDLYERTARARRQGVTP